jgi:hypothetical protein
MSIFIIPERHNRGVSEFIFSAETIRPKINTVIFVCSSFNLQSVTEDYMKQNDWMIAKNELALLLK